MDELNYVANIIKILLPMCNIGVGLKCHCIEKRGADLKWKFCFMSRVVFFMIMEFLSHYTECTTTMSTQEQQYKDKTTIRTNTTSAKQQRWHKMLAQKQH